MADLTQKIQLVVEGFKKLKNIQREVQKTSDLVKELASDFRQVDRGIRESQKTLNRVGRDRPRDAKGRYSKDPDRTIRNVATSNEVNLIKKRGTLLKINSALTAKTTALINAKTKELDLDKARQKSVQTELRLQANKTFISRKLIEGRAAGLRPTGFGLSEASDSARGKRRTELNQALNALEKGFNDLNVEGNENVATFRAFGSQISRTVEELNALNRAVAKGSIGLEKGRRLQERIAAIDPILRKTKSGAEIVGTGKATDFGQGAAAQRAREAASNVIAAAKSGDQNLYNAALSKATAAVSRLEREYKEAERVQKDASKQTSKRARAEARLQRMQKQRRGRIGKSMMIGGGFPLLFGGGFGQSIGGVVGGGLGEAMLGPGGGFAGAIAAQAVIQTVTKVVTGINKLGQSLNSLTADIGALTKSLGLVGTVEGERLRLIESLSGKQVALAEATRLLNEQIGTAATESLKIFNDKMKGMGNEFNKLLTKMSAVISELITDSGLLDFLHAITSFLNNLDVQKLKGITQIMMGVSISQYGMVAEGLKTLATDAFSDKKNDPTESTDKFKPVFEGQFKNIKEEKVHLLETITLGKTKAEINKKVFNFMEKIKTITKDLSKEEKASLEDQLIKRYEQLEILKTTAQLYEQIRQTIADGMVNAVEALIDKTKSLSEVLTGVLKQIARAFLSAGINSFVGGFKIGGKGITTVPTPFAEHVAAQGAYFSNGIKPFASGGMATRPTLGLVGEAGEDEYIIPASKMASSMQRYSAGARGEAVIPGTGSSYAGGGAGGSTTVNYSGPILNFNSEEFVPKSAVGQIIATATSQGAKAGENRTLSTLRNSRSARSRLGM